MGSFICTMICGGTSDHKEINDEVIEVCSQVRPALEEKLGTSCAVFEPKSYKSQVVAGTNFFVKVHVGDDKHVHLRIYRDLQGHVFLHGHQVDKSHEDPIDIS